MYYPSTLFLLCCLLSHPSIHRFPLVHFLYVIDLLLEKKKPNSRKEKDIMVDDDSLDEFQVRPERRVDFPMPNQCSTCRAISGSLVAFFGIHTLYLVIAFLLQGKKSAVDH